MKKASQLVAWTMTASTALWMAIPSAAAATPVYAFKWISQTPATVTADGVAHYVTANQGDTVTLSVTLQNTAGRVIKGKSSLPAAPAGYQVPIGSYGIGVRGDAQTPWIDASSFVLNGNRFVYYDGPDVAIGGNITMTFTVKVAATAANGTYNLYYKPVFDYEAWTRQTAWNGKILDKDKSDIFTRFYVGTTPTVNGNLNVGIASTTPAATSIAAGASDVPMANFTFTAGASDNALVSSIALTRTGLSVDTDVTGVKLYDGSTQLGSEQSFNTTTHKATFTGLAWLIPAGTSKTLTAWVSTASTNVGAVIQISIADAASVTLTGSGTIGGTFPATGNGFTLANVSVGTMDVIKTAAPAIGNILSGSTDQPIASFKFTSATEGFNINSVTFTETGTSVDSDVSNLRLKLNGVQIGSVMPALSGGMVTFTGSPLLSVPAGQNKTIYIDADIASGVTSQRTVVFQIYQASDVVAVGQNSHANVVILASGSAFTAQTGQAQTIIQGTLGVTRAATNLSAQSYVVGTAQAEVAKWKFSAGSNEGIKVTKLTFTNGGTSPTAADLQNARLYINGSAVATDDSGTVSATTIRFTNGNGLFTVPVSGNTEVTLKVDVSSSATASHTLKYYLSAVTDLEIYGLSSNAKIDSTTANITPITDVAVGVASDHTLAANGTLIVAAGSNTPPAANFSLGTSNFEFMQFTMQAISDAAQVTAITLHLFDDTSVLTNGTGADIGTGDVTNAKLYWWDGTSWTQLGSTINTPSTGTATFSFSHTIPVNTTETYKLVGDIPTGASLTNLFAGIGTDDDSVHIYDEVTASGVASGLAYTSGTYISAADYAYGSLFTKVTPTITATMSTVPIARTVVKNSNNVVLGRLLLAASAGEDINISTLRISADDTDISGNGSDSLASTNFSNIHLGADTNGDGTYELTTINKPFTDGGGSAIDYVTYSGSDFNNPTSWKIPSAGTLVVDILGNVLGSSGSWSFGMVDNAPVTSIVGSGASSTTAATIAGLGSAITSAVLGLTTGGSLAITLDSTSPTVQQVTASFSSNVSAPVARFKFAATTEDVRLEMIRVTDLADGNDVDFKSAGIHLYEGGTIAKASDGTYSLSGGTLIGTGTLTGTGAEAVDITLSPVVIVPVNTSKYITIVADINSIAGGAVSKHIPALGIDQDIATGNWTGTDPDFSGNLLNVKARGVSSGVGIGTAAAGSVDLMGNSVYVVKTKLGLAVNSASPSGTQVRVPNFTMYKLNATNTSTDTDARLRAGLSKDTDSNAGWSNQGTLAAYTTDTTKYVVGAGSVNFNKVDFTGDSTEGISQDGGATSFATSYTRVSYWVRSTAAIAAGDLTFVMATDAALTAGTVTSAVTACAINQWCRIDAAITPGATRYFGVVVSHASNQDNKTINVDGITFYNDSLKLTLTGSTTMMFATTANTLASGAVVLKNGSQTLATGYYNGGGTAGLSTTYGTVTFIPGQNSGETEITIPAGGMTLDFIADLTTLCTGAGTLSIQLPLGSATYLGSVTNGQVLWNDNSSTTTIGWVDSPNSPLSRGMTF